MTKRELLESIRRGELSPEQGLQQLRALAKSTPSIEVDDVSPTSTDAEVIMAEVVRLHRPGAVAQLQLERVPIGPPGPGQVRVRTRAFSLNFGDLLCVRGLYPTMPPYPFTPGFELAGVIDAVGPGVTHWRVGDEIMAMLGASMGAHASAVLIDAASVMLKPASISFAEACATPVAYLTAEHSLRCADLRAGESILIQSAAGGVGCFAVQLALEAGAIVYGTASTSAKLGILRELGVHYPINYIEDDFAVRVRELSGGRGVDVVLDTLAGDAIQKGLDLLAPGGRFVEIAVAGLKTATRVDLSHLHDNQSFISVDLRRLMLRDAELTQRYAERMLDALDRRAVVPTIGQVVPFVDVRTAYELLEQRINIGKIVVEVPSHTADASEPARTSASTSTSASASAPAPAPAPTLEPIAVIGMAGRFPGAADLDEFWHNLADGRDCVAEIPRARWDVRRWYDPDPQRSDTTDCRWAGTLADVDRFDPAFFNLSRREAELCEPQQRLFLQSCWHALEHGGYARLGRGGSGLACGVFVGASTGDYAEVLERADSHRAPQAMIGNESSVIAGRIAYTLDLHGPALVVNTACSASLVAVHLACESLRAGSCELALAGGVFVSLTPGFFVLASNARMLSPSGRCRAFSDDADGFVPGEGVGVVLLKSLAAAQRDGDRIYGIIRASGVNQDGRTNALTAPSARAQTELLRTVAAAAGISARTIDCVEAHGTGTRLGDPVEVHALTDAFRSHTDATGFCALGSVKSNIGHAVTAAGIASLLKVLLALEHQAIPPTLHAERDNAHIDFANSPFFISRTLQAWPRGDRPRRAAVSSFGFSGTNAHLIVEEPPRASTRAPRVTGPLPFPISARDREALIRVAAQLQAWLAGRGREVELLDVSTTLRRRAPLDERAVVIAGTREELERGLAAIVTEQSHPRVLQGRRSDAAKLPAALLGLAQRSLAEQLRQPGSTLDEAQLHALAELFVCGGTPSWERLPVGTLATLPGYPFARERCWPTLPSGTHELALERLSCPPRTSAGPVQNESDGLGSSCRRARGQRPFVGSCPPRTSDGLGSSCRRARGQRPFVGSDPGDDAVFRVQVAAEHPLLAEHRVAGRAVLPGVVTIELALAVLDRLAPGCAFVLERLVWLRPLASGPEGVTVYVVAREHGEGFELGVESDDGQLCAQLYAHAELAQLELEAEPWFEASFDRSDFYTAFEQAGLAYGPWYRRVCDLSVDADGALACVELPSERAAELSGYRLHPALADAALQSVAALVRTRDTAGQAMVAVAVARVSVVGRLPERCFVRVRELEPRIYDVVLFDGDGQPCVRFEGLELAALASTRIAFAPSWQPVEGETTPVIDDATMLLRPLDSRDDEALDHALASFDKRRLVYVAPAQDAAQALVALVQALDRRGASTWPLELIIVTHAAQLVVGDEPHTAGWPSDASCCTGLAAVVANEHPRWRVCCIDVEPERAPSEWRLPATPGPSDARLALRDGVAWQRCLLPIEWPSEPRSPYRDGGVYLIIGGAGTLGLALSRSLARQHRARLIWVGRRAWDATLREHAAAIEQLGGHVHYIQADIADRSAVAAVIAEALRVHAALHGVVHAALAYASEPLSGLRADRLDATLAYKLDATRELMHALRDVPLDFFVCCSSIQSLVGDIGQAAYAAASAGQDALAEQLAGRWPWPVKTIDWGYWGAGATATSEARERLAAIGYGVIAPEAGLLALSAALQCELPRVVVVAAAPDVLSKLGVQTSMRLELAPEQADEARRTSSHALARVRFPSMPAAPEAWARELDAALLGLFERLGLARGVAFVREGLAERLGIAPSHHALLDALLGLLDRRGCVRRREDARLELNAVDRPGPSTATDGLDAHRRLLATCMAAAPAILRGELPATDVLFPSGSTELVEAVYRGNPLADAFNRACADVVAAFVEAHASSGRALKILEIGAGTGGTTALVLDALREHAERVEYHYTDVSTAFLEHGRARFGAGSIRPSFATLDISRDVATQGFELGSYDLVLAANVLHATARMRESVRHARALLRPGGALVLNEVTRVEPFTTATFGLLRGWWAFTDAALRLPGGPLLDVPRWRRVLALEGLALIVALGPTQPEAAGQHVIVATSTSARLLARPVATATASASASLQKLATATRQVAAASPSSRSAARPASSGAIVLECLAAALSLAPADIDRERAFSEYGLDSLTGVELVTALNRRLGLQLRTTILYDYGNVDALVAHIEALPEFAQRRAEPLVEQPTAPPRRSIRLASASTSTPARAHERDIAIIGMAGRYPGAPDLDAYWQLLADGRCAVRDIPPERWPLDGFYDPTPDKLRSTCKVGGFIDDVDRFDPGFFRMSTAEAEQTSPQQRLFLEQAWRTIEDAGYSAQRLAASSCGVIAGGLDGDYLDRLVAAGVQQPQALWGNDSSVIAARVAYFLDLRGPTIVLNTACSSSLTAVHLACQRIRSGESELMLAGGSFLLDPAFYIFTANAGMLSPAGVCRAFDDRADGFVPGEGVGVVMLKSLAAALRDGDRIHGVIRASGINQDGRTNGITAPSSVSQTELELQVYREFGVDPSTISYIETHGTGTSLGDPIELEALTKSWRAYTDRRHCCAIGSVKTNIGHAAIASGMASLHKVLLALRHRSLPASLHYEQPNRHADLEQGPFFVNDTLRPWTGPAPLRAAISGFGMSGTNAHLVLEAPPPGCEREAATRPAYLFPFSARNQAALDELLASCEAALAKPPLASASPGRVAWTLQVGRSVFPLRAAFVAGSLAELREHIRDFLAGRREHARVGNLRREAAREQDPQLAGDCAALRGESDPQRLRVGLWTLAEAFVVGGQPDWHALLGDRPPTAIALPGHPLRSQRCWIPAATTASPTRPSPSPSPSPVPACAMQLRVATRAEHERVVEAELDLHGWLLDEHRVNATAILPGAAQIEFARAAARLLDGRAITGVRELVWLRPIIVAEAGVRIVFAWRSHAEPGCFEIIREQAGDALVCATGRVIWTPIPTPARREPRTSLGTQLPAGPELYRAFARMGIDYGPSFQVIDELHASADEAYARLRPAGAAARETTLELSPALLDGGLQSLIGLVASRESQQPTDSDPHVPALLDALDIHAPLRDACEVVVSREPGEGGQRYRIRIDDVHGHACVEIRGLLVRRLARPPSPTRAANTQMLWCVPQWRPTPREVEALAPGAVVAIGLGDDRASALRRQLDRELLNLPGARELAQRLPDLARLAAIVHVVADGPDRLDPRPCIEPMIELARALVEQHACDPRRRVRLLVVHADAHARPHVAARALDGLLRSLRAEVPGLDCASLQLFDALDDVRWAELVAAELSCRPQTQDTRRIEHGQRSSRTIVEIAAPPARPLVGRGDVVLITGGVGGLGAAFARALAPSGARLLLCGRRPANAQVDALLHTLASLGGEAHYVQADIGRRVEVERLVAEAHARFGALDGVIHAAASTADNKLARVQPHELHEVLAAKLDGARLLDEVIGARAEEKLRFTSGLDEVIGARGVEPRFTSGLDEVIGARAGVEPRFTIYCASMAGVFGNPGQATYAYANAWLDAFAHAREQQRDRGARLDITRAIDWPLWTVGLSVDRETELLLTRTLGLIALDEARGCVALAQALACPHPSVIPIHGDADRLRRALGIFEDAPAPTEGAPASTITERVRTAVAEALGLAVDDVGLDDPLAELGFDALSLTRLAQRLASLHAGPVSPGWLMQQRDLRALIEALHGPAITTTTGTTTTTTTTTTTALAQRLRTIVAELLELPTSEVELHDELSEFGFDSLKLTELANRINTELDATLTPASMFEFASLAQMVEALAQHGPRAPAPREPLEVPAVAAMPIAAPVDAAPIEAPPRGRTEALAPVDADTIAIVGMAGVMPGCRDLDAFWTALRSGQDLICEIPAERWDWRAIWGDPTREPNRTNARWGGFMPDVDRFDAGFFGISPREAELMDPQQRLILECVWHCIEDAGHRPSSLSGTRTAVYIGVAGLDYSELVGRAAPTIGAHSSTGMTHSMLANRVSFLLNLRGPSSPVDTACSSSLVAMLHAVDAIRSGAAELAIAGGVNTLLSPSMFISFAKAGMLSPHGRCRSFDDAADGYVRGEGVGAVLLKPLARARADGDHIYALIRAAGQNHGGRANSLTAPNPVAQASLLLDTWTRANVSPATLDYIEAHGTGTKLGDPIEINAIEQAIARFVARDGGPRPGPASIGVGTVKTNIGHLEAAAGIAGVLKILLALRHEQLPANLHFERLNRHISLDGSALTIVDRARAWPRRSDGRPRRAAVSSFGFGGANAHLVLEDELPPPDTRAPVDGPLLFVLSARSDDALGQQIDQLRAWLQREPAPNLYDLAFTLACGREPFAERLAIVAADVAALADALALALDRRGPAMLGSVEAVRRRAGVAVMRGSVEAVQRRAGVAVMLDNDPAHARLLATAQPDALTLRDVAQRWIAGDLHGLDALFGARPGRRLALPGYPFARERHWIDVPAEPPASCTSTPAHVDVDVPTPTEPDALTGFFHLPRWRRVTAPPLEPAPAGEVLWLVVIDEHDPAIERLARAADNVAVVTAELLARDDARACLRALPRPDHVVFLGAGRRRGREESDELSERASARVLALFRLISALLAEGLGRAPLRVSVASFGVHAVLPGERPVPDDAALHGLVGSLAREYPQWRVKLLDLADAPLDEHTCAALLAGSPLGLWLLRGEAWYARELAAIELPAVAPRYRVGGVVLIFGGTGGLGLTLATELARQRTKLVLIGRRAVDDALSRSFAALEQAGAELLYLQADAARPGSITAAVAAARARFGRIDAVVHAAMDLCDESLERMDEALLLRALAPKLHGTVELVRACAPLELDWLLLFSSGQSFSTDAGQANYAAASTFEDAFARALAAEGRVPVRIINWGYWGSVGAVRDAGYQRRMAARGLGAITQAQGLDAIARTLAATPTQLLAFLAEPWLLERMGIDRTQVLEPLADATRSPDRLLPILVPPLERAQLELARTRGHALERHAHKQLLACLHTRGLLPEVGERFEPARVAAALGVDRAHARVWAGLVELLREAGFLHRDGSPGEQALRVDDSAHALLHAPSPAAADASLQAHVRLLDTCVAACPGILSGATPAAEVLFPGGSMALVEGVYKGDAISDHHNRLSAAAVVAALDRQRALAPGQPLRVLEVGAGTGSTSVFVLPALAERFADVEYLYTDVSSGFVRHGERNLAARHPGARFRVLDLERSLVEQGVALGSVDVVLAANVVHATHDVAATLARLKAVLKPGGAVVLLETVQQRAFASLTFGLTPGWWAFDDPHWRLPQAPLLSVPLWRALLEQEGFAAVQMLGLPGVDTHEFVQSVIVGHSDGIVQRPRAGEPVAVLPPAPVVEAVAQAATGGDGDDEAVLAWLRSGFARVLKLDAAALDPRATFEVYGVDSLVGMEIVRELERELGSLPSTLLFENPTLRALQVTLQRSHAAELQALLGRTRQRVDAPTATPPPTPAAPTPIIATPTPAAPTTAGLVDAMLDRLAEPELDALLARLDHALRRLPAEGSTHA